MKRLLFSLIITIGVATSIYAAGGYPLLFSYTSEQYGTEAGFQNWDITRADGGEIYVANNAGVLRYDGYNWQLIPVPGVRTIRSVSAYEDRIYIGHNAGFGYLTRNTYGDYDYTSISQGLVDEDEDIWQIMRVGTVLYFQSFSRLYAYENEEVRVLDLDFLPFCIFTDGTELYLQAIDGDFYRLRGDTTLCVIRSEQINNDRIVGFHPIGDEHRFVVVTESNGLYWWNGHSLERFRTEADSLLRMHKVNRVCITTDYRVILGTYSNGVLAISREGTMQWHYSTFTGLPNDAVLRVYADRDNQIWACLDDGLAMIAAGSSYRVINGKTGGQFGTVYDVLRRGDTLFMATNQGVYRCCVRDSRPMPQLVAGTAGQVWYIREFEGTIFCGHNSGPMCYQNGKFVRIPGTQGSTDIQEITRLGEEYLIEASYYDLRLYHRENGRWSHPDTIAGFHHPIRNMVWEADGTLWASDMNAGVYRIRLSYDLLRAEEITYIDNIGGESAHCHVLRFNGRILFSNGIKLYYYDDLQGQFVPFEQLNRILPDPSGVLNIVEVNPSCYWICTKHSYILIRREDDQWHHARCIMLSELGCRHHEDAASIYEYKGVTYFNMAGALVSTDHPMVVDATHAQLSLHHGWERDAEGNYMPVSTDELVSGKACFEKNFGLTFSYPNYLNDQLIFSFEVEDGKRHITMENHRPEVVLPILSHGKKTLTARVLTSDHRELESLTFTFRILAPWYLRSWAIALWVLLLLLLVLLISAWITHKRTESQRLLLLEKERIISEQQKQLLKNELQLKSKDLASLSLDATIKNNVLQSIRQAIHTQQKQGNITKGALNAELLRINQTMGNEKNWEVYQQNFDLIHEHFFRHLKEQYPALTTGDLRLCALLRLNMSTKEIAGYTGLSVRGIETARFRLRKKLNLPQDTSLSDFLLSFK